MAETRNRKAKGKSSGDKTAPESARDKTAPESPPPKINWKKEMKTKAIKMRENQNKGWHGRLLTFCKILFVVLLVPPFLNYAALQRESAVLQPEGKIPPFLNYAALQRESAVLQPEGELYDIGWGQKLFLSCKGKGAPTVILDAPTGMTSDVWSLVINQVAKHSRVCVYDRAGLGFSDRPYKNQTAMNDTEEEAKMNYRNRWEPFTGERMVDDLHQLITRSSDQSKPFLLVGAELGALVAQFYTHVFSSDVMGLILINPLSDEIFNQDQGIWAQNWFGHVVPSYQTLQLGAALGVTRLSIMMGLLHHPMHMVSAAAIPEETIQRQKYLMCHPKHLSSVVDEHHFINETFSQFRTAKMIKKIPSSIPITIVTGNYFDEQMPGPLNKAWAKTEQLLVSQTYPHSQHIVVNGGDRHVMYQHPQAVVEPIRKAVKYWRAKHANERDS